MQMCQENYLQTGTKEKRDMGIRGRPRAFNRDEALKMAMRVFWASGYEGASMTELTQAMGINKPSLYAAFGCKESLFREAIKHYERVMGEPAGEALEKGRTARGAIDAVLRMKARSFIGPETPRGCMVVVSALAGAPENDPVCSFLAENRRDGEDGFRKRIERGIAEGDVPPGVDAASVATFYVTVLYGLAIRARDGASEQDLEHVIDSAMAAWDAIVR